KPPSPRVKMEQARVRASENAANLHAISGLHSRDFPSDATSVPVCFDNSNYVAFVRIRTVPGCWGKDRLETGGQTFSGQAAVRPRAHRAHATHDDTDTRCARRTSASQMHSG